MRSLGLFEWLAVGVVLVIIGGAVYFMLSAPVFTSMRELSDETRRFVDDIRAEQYADAYRRMSPDYRRAVSLKEFRESVAEEERFGTATQVSFRQHSRTGNAARLVGVLKSEAGDAQIVVNFTLTSDGWRIKSVSLGGMSALPSRGR